MFLPFLWLCTAIVQSVEAQVLCVSEGPMVTINAQTGINIRHQKHWPSSQHSRSNANVLLAR